MLAIRMQRTGRKGHANFRIVVQDSRQSPSSGKFVALLGHYDPHAKTSELVKEKVEFYLQNGARPSDRAAKLFQSQGITLPSWVKIDTTKSKNLRNADKLRKNRTEEAPASSDSTDASGAAESEMPETNTDEAAVEDTQPVEATPEAGNEESADEAAEPEVPEKA